MKLTVKIILIILFISYLFVFSNCSRQTNTVIGEVKKTEDVKQDSIPLSAEKQKILNGAKKCLSDKFDYDMKMAYHVLTYSDGVNTGKKVYPNGDLEPGLGVCTDVTIRALRYAGLYDLQKEIHEDILNNRKDYPMKRWGAKKPDTNIDHRRVPNQLVWLKKNFSVTDESSAQPGDIIVWDMNGDGWSDHIGIISDKKTNGTYHVIHNFPDPGYVAEENVMHTWEITGIFSYKK